MFASPKRVEILFDVPRGGLRQKNPIFSLSGGLLDATGRATLGVSFFC